CGCALGPKDIRDTVSDALAAASRVDGFLRKGYVSASPEKPVVNAELCDGCGDCAATCPVNAISIEEGKARINPITCMGCGACLPSCPREAIDFRNYTWGQLEAFMKGALANKAASEVRVIMFVERNIAYTGLDFLGLDRIQYSEVVRAVPVPSTAMVGLKHLLKAFALGADGAVLIEGQHWVDEKFNKGRLDSLMAALEERGVDSIRVYYSLVELPAYRKIADIVNTHASLIKDLGPLPDEVRRALKAEVEVEP
ncbi:MAG: hypothetical protein DRJ69_07480, partial [Thermoprotei archaeon]